MNSADNTAADACYTVRPNAKTVRVAEFRRAIERLERKMNVDYAACATAAEQAQWVELARAAARDLTNMVCKRANRADMDRRERALDRSASMIIQALGLG